MELLESMIVSFKSGGIFMYAILFVLACGTAIIIERTITLFIRARINAKDLWMRIEAEVKDGKLGEAASLCESSQAPLAKVLLGGVKRALLGGARQEIGSAIEEVMLEIYPVLERRIHYLYSLSNVATLLGLLGTVMGLTQSFRAVSLADPSQKAALLANGISLALNSTAFGLSVAILLMLTYSLMQSRGARLSGEVDEYSARLLNLLADRQSPGQK